jgi:D-amino-acid dehydrogenase
VKVVVIGAGVIGTTTAYYLSRAGCQVTVIDEHLAPGLETSFANAGQISYGYAGPWAEPGLPLRALKWALSKDSPLTIRPDGTLWQLYWTLLMLRNCTRQRYALNKGRLVELAEHSRACLKELRHSVDLEYEGRRRGTLQVFRTGRQFKDAAKDIAVLDKHGVQFELLDVEGCIRAESALRYVRHRIVGGLRLPDDETGDCHLFTTRLADIARARGVSFWLGAKVETILLQSCRLTHVVVQEQHLEADHFVVACGVRSRDLLKKIGLRIPIYPVKGYSITVPIVDPDASPVSTVMDETYKVAITRFENRIRVGGMADVVGLDCRLNDARKRVLEKSLTDLFPFGGDPERATFWAGFRAMTPDGPPHIGPTKYPNLWLNTGHGTLGWTLACGSAQLLAQMIVGYAPAHLN